MSQVQATAGRRAGTAVSTMVHNSARTGKQTAYITVGYIPWQQWRRWNRVRRHLADLMARDLPADVEVRVAFTAANGIPGKQRVLRKGRA